MSYNGSGTFQINTSGQPVVAGTVISSTAFNALTADLATGLSTAITKDGQTTTTARIPFAAGINSSLTTDSTSTGTGSIFTAGGVGIAKTAYIGTNLSFSGTGNRITGDFSNATHSSRALFQTSTANSNTAIGAIPVGTGNTAQFIAYGNGDPTNSSFIQLLVNAGEGRINTGQLGAGSNLPMTFFTGGSERVRIDTSGRVLVNSTSDVGGNNPVFSVNAAAATVFGNIMEARWTGTTSIYHLLVRNGNGLIGGITSSASTTSFVTSSDYRLKDNISPMTGALAKVSALKPVTYKWKVDGSDGQGFIAHELQDVVPHAVSGEKDGEQMQSVDYGRLTPILTAALQEAIAKIENLEARIAVLEAK